jgi:hypothetical protein
MTIYVYECAHILLSDSPSLRLPASMHVRILSIDGHTLLISLSAYDAHCVTLCVCVCVYAYVRTHAHIGVYVYMCVCV